MGRHVRVWQVAALASSLVGLAACGSPTPSVAPQATASPTIALTTPPGGASPVVEVTGLPSRSLQALTRAGLTPDEWSRVLRVAVGADMPAVPAVLGEYTVTDRALRFTPLFPFDEGRRYAVRLDLDAIPGAAAESAAGESRVVESTIGRPASTAVPSTVVAHVYPSGDVVPENLLRMYIEFSAPMGRKSGVDYITLLDQVGLEIPGAVLPLDYEFWSPDHTRFTVFFDPGRVKKGILPNQQMGRPLDVGTRVTLVISREWRDAHGLPLREDFRRAFRVGSPDERPLDTASWRIQSPPSGGRDGVIVTFPEPLDHGLLQRALGITRNGQPVAGAIAIDRAESRWTFTPAEPWRPGTYALLALDILEDLAGNQIGRAFEVDNFETVDKGPSPKSVTIPFTVNEMP